MNAMILAAGRGRRMRPLTDRCPKPLLEVAGQPLIARHLEGLARAGCDTVVVNVAWLGDQLRSYLGDGSAWGLRVVISDEGGEGLETAGGIVRALPWLRHGPFWVINGDIWTDFELASLPRRPPGLGHLVLVDNPPHNPDGDFSLRGSRVANRRGQPGLTYAGIASFSPGLFDGCSEAVAPLGPLLRAAADRGELAGSHHRGEWFDVGTPERLAEVDEVVRRRADAERAPR